VPFPLRVRREPRDGVRARLGWKGLALDNAAPIFVVNPNDAAAQEVSALDALPAHGVMLQPSSSREAVLRFRPDSSGWYSVQWMVRDIQSSVDRKLRRREISFHSEWQTLAEGFVSRNTTARRRRANACSP
jgi:hypothetical protein